MSLHALSYRALHDLEDIYDYVTEQSGARRAEALIKRILVTCDRVGTFPALGRRRPELDVAPLEVRSISEGEYVIFYCGNLREDVVIVRVLHAKRDIDTEFEI